MGAKGMTKEDIRKMWEAMPDSQKEALAGNKKRRVRIRCFPGSLAKLVNDHEINSDTPWLSDSPFKGLLRLANYKLNKGLIEKIALEFNNNEKSLIVSGKKHTLRVQDIIEILQLNSEMDESVRYTEIDDGGVVKLVEREPSLNFRRIFCSDGGVNPLKYVKMKKVSKMIKNEVNAENKNHDNLKQAFALAALHSIVYAPACGKMGHRELGMVEDVEKIRNFPWANLAMEYLVNGIDTYQKGKEKDKKDEKKKMKIGGKKAGESGKEREREMSIGGCTIVLQLYYLMKLTNKPIEELLKLKSEELLESESEWESKPELPEWNEMFENQQIMEHNQKIQKHIDLLKGIDAENMNKEKKKKVKELTIKIHELEVLITQALQQDAIESYQRKMDIQQKSDQLNKLVSELSEIVNESAEGEAEDKIKVGPFNVRAILEVSDDDRRLMNWIFCSHEHGDMCVAKIPTGCFSLAKSELQQYLPPKQCLSNFIINHVAERLCLQENTMKDLTKWYHLVDANVHTGMEQGRMNLRDSSQFMSVKQFFFPICKSSHFFLIVVNTEKLNVEVWDSLKREDITSYTSEIDIVLKSLRTITKRTDSFSGYKRVLVDIPQQTNGHDCGLFVYYYLEYPNHVMKFHKEKWISDEQRLRLSSRILNSRHNTQRDLVYEYVEKWSKANESSSTPSSTPSATFKEPSPGKPKDTSPKKPKDTSPKKPLKKVARKCRVLKDLISPLPSGTKRLRRTLYRDSLRK